MSKAGTLNWTTSWQNAQDNSGTGTHLRGWIHEGEANRYHQLAKNMKPGQTVLEIGTYSGCTPALFALVAPKGVQVIAIDDFSNKTHENGQRSNGVPEELIETLLDHLIANWIACGVEHDVELIVADSHAISSAWQRPLDILIVDGDHSVSGCLADMQDYGKWVTTGGLLIVDDYAGRHEGVRDAVDIWRDQQRADVWEVAWEVTPPEGTSIAFRRL